MMNILIVTTYFPPDSTIASVRPYMFARYLSENGHGVTVLRSGEFQNAPFDEYTDDERFEVISVLGKNSPAEKYKRNEYQGFAPAPARKGQKLPRRLRIPIKAVRDSAWVIAEKPPRCIRRECRVLKYHQKAVDRLYGLGRRYDVVFSTCGDLENIYAGKYAAEKFGAKWIMDFRDSMIFRGSMYEDFWWNRYAKDATLRALKEADCVTAVSYALADELRDLYPPANIRVLHNGYDDTEAVPEAETDPDVLTMCYTGRIYDDRKPALEALAVCIAKLIADNKADRNRIRIKYAGAGTEAFEEIFKAHGIADVLDNKGYLSKHDTFRLQLESDLFIVLSWNTKQSKGILTGKFYEGIKAGKPILSLLTGNAPDSELMQLQREYDYGFCYEHINRKAMMPELEKYIEGLYREKISCGKLSYKPKQELCDAFGYTRLSEDLLKIMKGL